MTIRENRFHTITDKVFTLENVYELATLLSDEFEKEKSSKDAWLNFTAKCFDNSSYESQSVNLFAANSTLAKKRVKSINMEFRKGNEKHINIKIVHGHITVDDKDISSSEFDVGGTDSFWVSGIENKIFELIQSFKIQDNYIYRHRIKFLWVSFISGTYLFGKVVDLTKYQEKNFEPYWSIFSWGDSGEIFGFLFLAFLLGGFVIWLITSNIISKSIDYWPITEINIGPAHFNKEKKQRQFYTYLVTSLILPVLLSVIANIITLLL
jgi:hypothetical protein